MVERTVKITMGFVRRAKNAKQAGRYGTLTQKQKKAAARLERGLKSVLPHLADDLRFDTYDLWQAAKAAASKKLGPSRPVKAQHIEAANAAYRLLERHDLPVTVSKRRGRDRFLRLAALLSGDERANLYHACRRVKADQNGA